MTWRYRRLSLRIDGRCLAVGLILSACVVVAMLVHLKSGTLNLSYADMWASFTNAEMDPVLERILWRLRLPRVITAVFVGACLGLAGAVFQSVSRNPLGSPDILGFTTGAATGAILQIIVLNAGPWQTVAAAILSGLMTSVIIFLLSLKRGEAGNIYRFILTGIGVGATLAGINTILLVMGDLDQAANAQLWLSGSLNVRTVQHALLISFVFILIAPIILSQQHTLSLMEMGDDIARQLGARLQRTRMIAIIGAIILTAGATAVAGPIAFVALAAPQLTKTLTRVSSTPLFVSALMGAFLLVGADLVALNMPFNFKMPIGLITGFLGGTYLLWLLARKA